jgi:hypothetical protein
MPSVGRVLGRRRGISQQFPQDSSRRTAVAKGLKRRQFLTTLGASAAMLPVISSLRGLARAASAGPPKRLITFYCSSGTSSAYFWPDQTGTNFQLKSILAPLAPYQAKLSIIQGLGLGPGSNHGYGMQNCLTVGAKTSYENVLADALSAQVLNLCVAPLYAGEDMSQRNGMMLHGISDPQLARDEVTRLVTPGAMSGGAAPDPNVAAIRRFKTLALGLTQKELDQLKTRVQGLAFESAKIQSHIEAVQSVKTQLTMDPTTTMAPTMSCSTLQTTALTAAKGLASDGNAGMPNLPLLLDAQIENVVESFRCGNRTIANLQLMHAWGNVPFSWLGFSKTHHQDLSHWIPSQPTGQTAQDFATCNTWVASRFLTLLQKLDVPDPMDPGKTMLDNTVILWTSEVNGSDSHIVDSIPIVVAGNWGGTLRTGQALNFTAKRNMGDLFASLMTGMGVTTKTFGTNGSTGPVTEILA